MRIKVAFRDKVGKDFIVKELQSIKGESQLDLERIAKETEDVIKQTIMTKAKNATGNLASHFYAHKSQDGWAVGDIDELDTAVPHWNHQDKGSEGIGANWDHFLPKGYWTNGRWVESPDGYSGIKPKTPIPAMNYIADTLLQMAVKIPKLLKR